jgi:hypothetical protein
MRRAAIVFTLLVSTAGLVGACASVANTPEQELAYQRWRKCSDYPDISLKEIRPDGQIWVTYSGPSALSAWQACIKAAAAADGGKLEAPVKK